MATRFLRNTGGTAVTAHSEEEDGHVVHDSIDVSYDDSTFSAGDLQVKAIHYYHNASYHSSQASCRTPTATAVTWQAAYDDNGPRKTRGGGVQDDSVEEEEDDDDDSPHSRGGGCRDPDSRPGGAPPSPQKMRVGRRAAESADNSEGGKMMMVHHRPSYRGGNYGVDSPFLCGAAPPGMPFPGKKTQQQLEAEAEATTVIANNKKKGLTHSMKNMMHKLANKVLSNKDSKDHHGAAALFQKKLHNLKSTTPNKDHPDHLFPPTPPRVAKTPATWSYSPQSRSSSSRYGDRANDDCSDTSPLRKGVLFGEEDLTPVVALSPTEQEAFELLQQAKLQSQAVSTSVTEICTTTVFMDAGNHNNNKHHSSPQPQTSPTAAASAGSAGKVILSTIQHGQPSQLSSAGRPSYANTGPVDLDESIPSSREESFTSAEATPAAAAACIDEDLANALDMNNITIDEASLALDGSFAFQQHEVRLKVPPPTPENDVSRDTIPELFDNEYETASDDEEEEEEEEEEDTVDTKLGVGPVDLDVTPSFDESFLLSRQQKHQSQAANRKKGSGPVDLDDTVDSTVDRSATTNGSRILEPPRLFVRRTGPLSRMANNSNKNNPLLPPRPPNGTPSPPKPQPQEPQQFQAKFKIVKVFGSTVETSSDLNSSQEEDGDKYPLLRQHHQQLRTEDYSVGALDMNLGTASSILDDATTVISSKPSLTLAHNIDESLTTKSSAMMDDDGFPTAGSAFFQKERLQHAFDEACRNDGRQYSRPVDDQDLDDSLAWISKRSFASTTTPPIAQPTAMPAPRIAPSVRDSPRHFGPRSSPARSSNRNKNQESTTVLLQHSLPPRSKKNVTEEDFNVATETKGQTATASADPLYSASLSLEVDRSQLLPSARDSSSPARLGISKSNKPPSSPINTVLLQDIIPPWKNDSLREDAETIEDSVQPSVAAGTQDGVTLSSASPARNSDGDMMFQMTPVGSSVVEMNFVKNRKERAKVWNDVDESMENSGASKAAAASAGTGQERKNQPPVAPNEEQMARNQTAQTQVTAEETNVNPNASNSPEKQIRPKSFSERQSSLPPPSFKDTQGRLVAVWEEPRSRKRSDYTGPVDLDDTIDTERIGRDDVYSGPVDLDDSIVSSVADEEANGSSPMDGGKAAKATEEQKQQSQLPKAKTHESSSTIDWNAFAGDSDNSDDSHSQVFYTDVAVPSKKKDTKPKPHSNWTDPKLSSSDDDSCAAQIGSHSPTLDAKGASKSPDWASFDQHINKASHGVLPNSGVSHTIPEKGQAQDIIEDLELARTNIDANHEAQSRDEMDDSDGVEKTSSDESVSAGELIRDEFKNGSFERDSSESVDDDIGDIDEAMAMEVGRFKKICMQNAMKSRTPKLDTTQEEETVTSSVVEDIRTSKESYASVMMELERVFLPKQLQKLQSSAEAEDDPVVAQRGPDQDAASVIEVGRPDVQEQIQQSIERCAQAKATLDIGKLENEIKKLQATAAALKAEMGIVSKTSDSESTPTKQTIGEANGKSTSPLSVIGYNLNVSRASSKLSHPFDESSVRTTPSKRSSSTTQRTSPSSVSGSVTTADYGADDENGFAAGDASTAFTHEGSVATMVSANPSTAGFDLDSEAERTTATSYSKPSTTAAGADDATMKSDDVWAMKELPFDGSVDFDDELGQSEGSASTQRTANNKNEKRSVPLGKRMIKAFNKMRRPRRKGPDGSESLSDVDSKSSQAADLLKQLKMKSRVIQQIDAGPDQKRPSVNMDLPLSSDSERSYDFKRVPKPNFNASRPNRPAREKKGKRSRRALKPLPPPRSSNSSNRPRRLPSTPEGKALFEADFNAFDSPSQVQTPPDEEKVATTPFNANVSNIEAKDSISDPSFSVKPDPATGSKEDTFCLEDRMIKYLLQGIDPPGAAPSSPENPNRCSSAEDPPGSSGEDSLLGTRSHAAEKLNAMESLEKRLMSIDDLPDRALVDASEDCTTVASSHDQACHPYERRSRSPDPHFDQLVESLVQRAIDSDASYPSLGLGLSFSIDESIKEKAPATPEEKAPIAAAITPKKAPKLIIVETVGSTEEFSVTDDGNSKSSEEEPKTRVSHNMSMVTALSGVTPMTTQVSTPTQTRATTHTPQTIRTCTTASLTPQTVSTPGSASNYTSGSAHDEATFIQDGSFLGIRDSVTGLPVEVRGVDKSREEEEPNPKDISISEAMSVECTWESFSIKDRRRSLIPPTIPEEEVPEEDQPPASTPPADSKKKKELTDHSPSGVTELDSYCNHTMTLESSGYTNDTEESSFGDAPRPLASDEETSPVRPHDSVLLKQPIELTRSKTPDRKIRIRAARNETPTTESSGSEEDNVLNPCVYPTALKFTC